MSACHEMNNGEILNAKHTQHPLFNAILYGDKVLSAKFSKRLSCAVKHLPLRVAFSFEYNTLKALDAGVRQDPTLMVDGKIFLEGLVQAEEITQKFQELLNPQE